MTVGDRIKKQRELLNFSQTELAEKIKVSKQTLYKYETNIVTNIPSDKIEAIAAVLNVTPPYLMGWDEQKQIDSIVSDVGLGMAKLCPELEELDLDIIMRLNKSNRQKINVYAKNLLNIQTMEDEPMLMAAHHDNPTDEQREKIIKDMDILKRPTKQTE